MKKQKVIIVPGSNTGQMTFLRPILTQVNHLFGVDEDDADWVEHLCTYLQRTTLLEVDIFQWNGGITRTFSIVPAARELSALIDQQKEYARVILFCKSLGGIVGEMAAKTSVRGIDKLISVATPHRNSDNFLVPPTEVINIFSPAEKYFYLAKLLLNFGLGNREVNYGKNISLNNLRHSDFNYNRLVSYQGEMRELFDIYRELIVS